ncbi:MAG: acyl-ACP--UDP-N-acetylglucosamine O-acyltransferase [Halobacteriovoraceae bacterium]|jgi:UDP-N-acetylglucosamine acyltransferase|nr:acyl-ACP--UDP-N-acetylglucosamine O-acyltransferase [Halobacteriovoraceae bacterium]MBT5096010.1 acyl-ACP--UDP-N-acetylglucosamine O-acyltransferase [Halobacteriovoraceae bacterium]
MLYEKGIHELAVVHPDAKIGEGVSIGPYTFVGPHVEIGPNCVIHHHATIEGHTRIGKDNQIFQYCSIGAPPQDLTYNNEPTRVEIGEANIFREFVSVHRGTTKENQVTTIGNNSLFMAYVHLGHDVVIGDKVVIANSCNLAGHVKLGDRAVLGGGCNISQFVSIGRGAYLGGAAAIDRDIPLFCTAYGNRAKLKGINIIGLRRHGYSKTVVSEVVDFYRTMESSALSPRAFIDHEDLMSEYKGNEIIEEMADGIRNTEVGVAPFLMS